jgi:carbamoyltransferase
MIIWGMSKNGHDYAIAIFKDSVYIKSITGKAKQHTLKSVLEAKEYGEPDLIVWYENPYLKALRQFIAGQPKAFRRNNIRGYLKSLGIKCKWTYVGHHESHAAAYYDTGLNKACIVVIDSIGEFDCTTIWKANGDKLTKLVSVKYPHSLGLFYSAMTDRIGFKPQRDEAKVEKLAESQKDYYMDYYVPLEQDMIKAWSWPYKFKHNLHKGARGWKPELKDKTKIAAATQRMFERILEYVFWKAKNTYDSNFVVVSGGCAYNKSVKRIATKYFKTCVIAINPSDAGSSKGAVLSYLKKHG